MKNNNRNQVTKLGLYLAAASPLVISCFLGSPTIAQDSLRASSFNISDVKAAIKESRKTGKPLLTDKTLSDQISKLNSSENKRATYDLKSFINKNFSLTNKQKRGFNNLSKQDTDKIRAALSKAQKENIPVKFSFATINTRPADGLVRISEVSGGLRRTAKKDGDIHIHIHIHCCSKKDKKLSEDGDTKETRDNSDLPAFLPIIE